MIPHPVLSLATSCFPCRLATQGQTLQAAGLPLDQKLHDKVGSFWRGHDMGLGPKWLAEDVIEQLDCTDKTIGILSLLGIFQLCIAKLGTSKPMSLVGRF